MDPVMRRGDKLGGYNSTLNLVTPSHDGVHFQSLRFLCCRDYPIFIGHTDVFFECPNIV